MKNREFIQLVANRSGLLYLLGGETLHIDNHNRFGVPCSGRIGGNGL